jgi:glycosyltransferase involved in cell wall biosynthesis
MTENSKLISVALCTYNGEAYLEEQLSSILAQTYQNLELVVVDDGSSDNTISIVRKFQEQDARIKLHCNETNLGFNINFSKALSLCTGEFISISDQDDVWVPHKLSTMVSLIGDNLLSYHNSGLIDEAGKRLGKSRLSTHRFVSGSCSKNLVLNNCISGHACLFAREFIPMIPRLPKNFYYDWWLAYTAACSGRINFTKEELVLYRIHTRSITQRDTSASKLSRIRYYELFKDHPLTPPDTRVFLEQLLKKYNGALSKVFSFSLLFYLLRNYSSLFYTRKRCFFSHLKFIVRECIQ